MQKWLMGIYILTDLQEEQEQEAGPEMEDASSSDTHSPCGGAAATLMLFVLLLSTVG